MAAPCRHPAVTTLMENAEEEAEGVWRDEQQAVSSAENGEEEEAAAGGDRHDNLPAGDAACSRSDRVHEESRDLKHSPY